MDPNTHLRMAVSDAWATMRRHAAALLVLCLVVSTPLVATGAWFASTGGATEEVPPESLAEFARAFVAYVGSMIMIGTLVIGTATSLSLTTASRGVGDVGDALRSALPKVPRLAWLSVLQTSACVLGFCLFLIPGFIATARFSLAAPIVIDQNLSAVGAMRASWEQTRGNTRAVLNAIIGGGIVGGLLGLVFLPAQLFAERLVADGNFLVWAAVNALHDVVSMVPGALVIAAVYLRLRALVATRDMV